MATEKVDSVKDSTSETEPNIRVTPPDDSDRNFNKRSYDDDGGEDEVKVYSDVSFPKTGNGASICSPAGRAPGPGLGKPSAGILAPSRLGSNPFSCNRASGFQFQSKMASSNILKPARLQGPAVAKSEEEAKACMANSNPFATIFKESDSESAKENEYDEDSEKNKNKISSTPVLGRPPDPINTNSQFIFGQNLSDRVVGAETTSPSTAGQNSTFVFGENLTDRLNASNGNTPEKTDNGAGEEEPNQDDATSPDRNQQTLEESAREYQARHHKPEYKEVEVMTGEEDESNVLQANCKLFLFDGTNQLWIEKGRGLLRLNDKCNRSSGNFHSRIVMRTSGTLNVILNCNIWPGMTVEKASEKSIRLTVVESDGVRIYLITCNPKESENLFRAIDWRIQQLKTSEDKEASPRKVEKRKAEEETASPEKKGRFDKDDNNSNLDPETEVSSESCTSSSQANCSETE